MILTNVFGEVIAVVFIILIIGGSILYIIKAKKNGVKCIGCPDAKTCNTKNLKKLCCEELKKINNHSEGQE